MRKGWWPLMRIHGHWCGSMTFDEDRWPLMKVRDLWWGSMAFDLDPWPLRMTNVRSVLQIQPRTDSDQSDPLADSSQSLLPSPGPPITSRLRDDDSLILVDGEVKTIPTSFLRTASTNCLLHKRVLKPLRTRDDEKIKYGQLDHRIVLFTSKDHVCSWLLYYYFVSYSILLFLYYAK